MSLGFAQSAADPDRVAAAFAADVDPWPVWRALREQGPVVESGPMFLVTAHAAVGDVFRRPTEFSSNSRQRGSRADFLRGRLTDERRAAFDEISEFHSHWMQVNDGETHRRLRSIAHRIFTPRRIADLTDTTERFVREEVDKLIEDDIVDLKRLAVDLPLLIMMDLLGVPKHDREQIKGWSRDWFEYQFVDDDRIFLSRDAQRGFRAYVSGMLEAHRRSPDPTDLAAALVGAEYEERLSADEVAGMYFMLLFAGHETTSNLIGSGMLALLQHPEQWRWLVADQGLVDGAVDELLRYVSPVQYLHRFTMQDANVGGTLVPAGATTTLVLACANRDADVFDDPDRLDIRRPNASRHIAFGFGPHFCLGVSLARMEGRTALRELAARLPDLELAADAFRWRGGSQLRGLDALPVRIGSPRGA